MVRPTIQLNEDIDRIEAQLVSVVNVDIAALEAVRAIFATSGRQPVSVLCLGHSYVAGLTATREEQRWVNRLARELQAVYPSGIHGYEAPVRLLSTGSASVPRLPGVAVVNGGISGAYANDYVPAGTLTNITTLQPKIVFHMIGVNDYQLGVSKANYKSTLTASIAAVDAACTVAPLHVLVDQFASPQKQYPVTPWSDYMAVMKELSDASPTHIAYISVFGAFDAALASGWASTDPFDLIDPDLLHPNSEGHALIARVVGERLHLPPAPIVRTPEVFDRFNRLALRSTETAQPWVTDSGTFVPTSTGLQCTVDGQAVVGTGFSDCEVSALVVHGTNTASNLVIKSNSDTTGLRVSTSSGGDNIVVYDGASLLTWSAALGLVVGREYHLAVSVQGTALAVFLNGNQVLTYTLSGTQVTNMANWYKHGVRGALSTADTRFRNFAVRRLGGTDGGVGGDPVGQGDMSTADLDSQHSNSTTTCTIMAALSKTLGAGTYTFDYFIRARSATAAVSPMFALNFTGTATANWWFEYADESATLLAAIGMASSSGSTAFGFAMRSAQKTFATTVANMGVTGAANAVDATATDILYKITGLIVVTVSGSLNLYHGSETNTATTVEVGTSLVVIRTA